MGEPSPKSNASSKATTPRGPNPTQMGVRLLGCTDEYADGWEVAGGSRRKKAPREAPREEGMASNSSSCRQFGLEGMDDGMEVNILYKKRSSPSMMHPGLKRLLH